MSDNNDLDIGVNVKDIKKSSTVYPAQTARMLIETMKIEMNKDETIKNLNVRLAFVGGANDGKKLFARHPVATTRSDAGMQTAVAIGLDRVKELGEACGVSGSNLAGCLHKEVDVTIGISKAKGDFPESNDVKKYAPAAAAVKASGVPTFLKKKAAAKPEAPKAEEPAAEPAADVDDLPF